MDLWQPLGPHRYQLRGDVLIYEQHGALSPDQMRELLALSTQQGEQYGYVIIIANAKDAAQATPESRQLASRWQIDHPYPSLALVFGTSTIMRVAARLFVRANQLMNATATDMRFIAREEDAWAVIELERERLRRGRKPL